MNPVALSQLLNKHFGKASMLSKFSLIVIVATVYAMLCLYKRVELTQEAVIHCHEQRITDIHLVLQKINKLDNKLTIGDILPDPAMAVVEEIAKKKEKERNQED